MATVEPREEREGRGEEEEEEEEEECRHQADPEEEEDEEERKEAPRPGPNSLTDFPFVFSDEGDVTALETTADGRVFVGTEAGAVVAYACNTSALLEERRREGWGGAPPVPPFGACQRAEEGAVFKLQRVAEAPHAHALVGTAADRRAVLKVRAVPELGALAVQCEGAVGLFSLDTLEHRATHRPPVAAGKRRAPSLDSWDVRPSTRGLDAVLVMCAGRTAHVVSVPAAAAATAAKASPRVRAVPLPARTLDVHWLSPFLLVVAFDASYAVVNAETGAVTRFGLQPAEGAVRLRMVTLGSRVARCLARPGAPTRRRFLFVPGEGRSVLYPAEYLAAKDPAGGGGGDASTRRGSGAAASGTPAGSPLLGAAPSPGAAPADPASPGYVEVRRRRRERQGGPHEQDRRRASNGSITSLAQGGAGGGRSRYRPLAFQMKEQEYDTDLFPHLWRFVDSAVCGNGDTLAIFYDDEVQYFDLAAAAEAAAAAPGTAAAPLRSAELPRGSSVAATGPGGHALFAAGRGVHVLQPMLPADKEADGAWEGGAKAAKGPSGDEAVPLLLTQVERAVAGDTHPFAVMLRGFSAYFAAAYWTDAAAAILRADEERSRAELERESAAAAAAARPPPADGRAAEWASSASAAAAAAELLMAAAGDVPGTAAGGGGTDSSAGAGTSDGERRQEAVLEEEPAWTVRQVARTLARASPGTPATVAALCEEACADVQAVAHRLATSAMHTWPWVRRDAAARATIRRRCLHELFYSRRVACALSALYEALHRADDDRLAEARPRLEGLPLSAFGSALLDAHPPEEAAALRPYRTAIKLLDGIRPAESPTFKLASFRRAYELLAVESEELWGQYRGGDGMTLNADVLLPIICYVVAQLRELRVSAETSLLLGLFNREEAMGEDSYMLTSLQIAASHVVARAADEGDA